MATVEYAGGGATSAINTASATTTVAVPLLNPTPVGQPMIIAVASDASTGSWSTPSGWSVLMASIAVASDMVVAAYYKYSAGTEGASVSCIGPSGHMVGASVSLRCATGGAPATGLPAPTSVSATGATQTGGPTTGGTLSPAVRTNGLAVRINWCSSNSGGANGTMTAPAGGWTMQQKFINSSGSSAFCTGICISTQPSSAPAAAASASLSSAWQICDSWWVDGAYPKAINLAPLAARMRAYNW